MILFFSLSIFLLMAENYMPVYMHAFTCMHIFIHIYNTKCRNFDTFKSCSFQLENIDWPTSDTVSSTPTSRCVSPWTHFFFIANFRNFDTFKITTFDFFLHYIIKLTHTFRSSNHKRAADHVCNSRNIGHYDRYYLRNFVKPARNDLVQI